MSDNIWFPFYWGDYKKDTPDLTLVEHGAYLMLMGLYYSQGAPIECNCNANASANASRLHRACMAFAPEEQAAVQTVLNRFFYKDGDVYRHKRIDKELKKQRDLSETRAEAARLRWEKHREELDANADANALQLDTQSQSQSPSKIESKADLKTSGADPADPPPAKVDKPKRRSIPKSIEEVQAYIDEKKLIVKAEDFWQHFTTTEPKWEDSRGEPVKNWKQKLHTWNRAALKRAENAKSPAWAGQSQKKNSYIGLYDKDYDA